MNTSGDIGIKQQMTQILRNEENQIFFICRRSLNVIYGIISVKQGLKTHIGFLATSTSRFRHGTAIHLLARYRF